MVIPVFYDVDPCHVRKQKGDFGKVFKETCEGKPEDVKKRWIRALAEVANMAGEDFSQLVSFCFCFCFWFNSTA